MFMKVCPAEAQTQIILSFQLQLTHSCLAVSFSHEFCVSDSLFFFISCDSWINQEYTSVTFQGQSIFECSSTTHNLPWENLIIII